MNRYLFELLKRIDERSDAAGDKASTSLSSLRKTGISAAGFSVTYFARLAELKICTV